MPLLLPLFADPLPPPPQVSPPPPALAASSSPPPPAPGPSTPATLDESVQDHIPAHSIVLHPWSMLDPHLSRRETYVWGGPVWERPVGAPRYDSATSGGFALGYGRSIESRSGVLLVRANAEHGFRFTGSNHLVVGLGAFMAGAGLVLGPVETTVRAGLVAAELHFGHDGFGFGSLSPRADVGVALTVGPLRVGARATSEYSWRWTEGGPSAFVRGVIFEIALGGVPPLPEMYRVER